MQEHTPSPSTVDAVPRLALLIDAENMSATCLPQLMPLVAECGNATVRRAYADWTNPHLAGWRMVLERQVIRPIQQFHYRNGRNASDSALIMDAMELLHAPKRQVDGFCIVSSDGGYTGLVGRIREAGLRVYGFGRAEASRSFMAACNAFKVLNGLEPARSGPGSA